jgi:hypothetical protein
MPAYDGTRFDPPAPVAYVTLRNPESGATLPDVPMLLDSGSDITLLPRAVMSPLGLSAIPNKHYELLAFDGSRSFAAVIRLELLFCRRTFRGQFIVIEQNWGILGRNVLNTVALLLDGPNRVWDQRRPN